MIHFPEVRFVLDAPEDTLSSDLAVNGILSRSGLDMVGFPPSFLKDLTVEASTGGMLRFEAKFADMSFDFIEAALMNPRRAENPDTNRVALQWGYFSTGNVSPIYRMFLKHAIPSFGEGVEWLFDGVSSIGAVSLLNNLPISWSSKKVSDAVQVIADALRLKTVIEDTREDPLHDGGTGRHPHLQYIRDVLLPRAVNVDGVGGYNAYVGPDPENRNINALHFHTRDHRYSEREIPTFNYLRGGRNAEVLEFTPSISSGVGSVLASGLTIMGADSIGKDAVQEQINDQTVSATGKVRKLGIASGYAIRQPPEDIGNSPDAAQVWLPYRDAASLRAHALAVWDRTSKGVYSATLSLAGTPKTVQLVPGDFIKVLVTLPIPSRQALHWSSGVWWIKKVTHQILTGSHYKVDLELWRDSHLTGLYVFPDAVQTLSQEEQLILDDPTAVGLPSGILP